MLRIRLGILVMVALLVALVSSALLTVALFERHQLSELSALLARELDRVQALMSNPEIGASLLDDGVQFLTLQLVGRDDVVMIPEGSPEPLPVTDSPSWVTWDYRPHLVASEPWIVGSGLVIGTVRLGYDASNALAVRSTLRTSLLWAAGVIALLSGALALIVLSRQLRPLTRLAEEAAALEPADPVLNLPPMRDDEVGRVGTALESAVNAIRQHRQEERDALAGVAHELAAPLTVVAGQLEALAANDDSRQLHAARDAARELLHTSQDLLTLARGELRMPLQLNVVALAQVAERVTAEYPGVHFAAEGAGLVLGSQERLAQIVRNLVRNAVQAASGAAGVSVTVAEGPEQVTLEVTDDGPGVDDETRAHMFDRHFTRRDSQGGSGLGLSVVRELVEAHGGQVEVLAAVGGGARFRVTLASLEADLGQGDEFGEYALTDDELTDDEEPLV